MNDDYDMVVRTLLSLQLPSGGFLAGRADDRFPYVYPRDCVFICNALLKAGYVKEVKKCYEYLLNIQDESGEWKQRYNPETNKPEVSRPGETDNIGLVLHGLWQYVKQTNDIDFANKCIPYILAGRDYIESLTKNGLISSQHSVYEHRGSESGYEIWVNCWIYRGLRDASYLLEKTGGHKITVTDLVTKASILQLNISSEFWDDKYGLFAKVIRPYERIVAFDISGLAPYWTKVITKDDPRTHRIVTLLDAFLWDDDIGGHNRYRKWLNIKDWHWYDGGSGPFVYWTALMARTLRELGYRAHADRAWNWVQKTLREGMLPEHIATISEFNEWKSKESDYNVRIAAGVAKTKKWTYCWDSKHKVVCWVMPHGWSHAEYVMTYLDYRFL